MDNLKKHMKKAVPAICLLGLAYILLTVADVALYFSDQITDAGKLVIIIAMCLIWLRAGRGFFEFTHTKTVFLISVSMLILIHVTELTEEFPVFG